LFKPQVQTSNPSLNASHNLSAIAPKANLNSWCFMLLEQLDIAQQDHLPEYRAKWQGLARSTKPIDRQAARNAINQLYARLGYAPPTIEFCQSPKAIVPLVIAALKSSLPPHLEWLIDSHTPEQRVDHIYRTLGQPLAPAVEHLRHTLEQVIDRQLGWSVQMELETQLGEPLRESPFTAQLWEQLLAIDYHLRPQTSAVLTPETWLDSLSVQDFAQSIGCQLPDSWRLFQNIVEHCGWLVPYESICWVCDRPRHLSLDAQGRLHGEGITALEFADGFGLYAYQGLRLPDRYGRLHPHQWRANWLLNEPNAALRRVLIQGIGYGRLCQELEAEEIDSYRDYRLLELAIEDELDEPIYLLKMICPSTGFIYVVRVPPDIEDARSAVAWINWDVDPETFSIET
jgi:hypothetical protein